MRLRYGPLTPSRSAGPGWESNFRGFYDPRLDHRLAVAVAEAVKPSPTNARGKEALLKSDTGLAMSLGETAIVTEGCEPVCHAPRELVVN